LLLPKIESEKIKIRGDFGTDIIVLYATKKMQLDVRHIQKNIEQ
jgi:hypothetical protein